MVNTPLHDGRGTGSRDLGAVARWQLATSIALLVGSAVAAGIGIIDGIFDGLGLATAQLQAQDAVTLLLGVPLGAIGLWAATQGSARGSVLWIGALGLLAYAWGSYVVMLVLAPIYVLYVALFALAVVTLVGALAGGAAEDAAATVSDGLPPAALSGGLAAVGALLAAAWLLALLPETVAGDDPGAAVRVGQQSVAVAALELGVLAPGALAVAAGSWSERPWAAMVAGPLLVTTTGVGASLLAIGVQLRRAGEHVAAIDLALVGLVTLLALALTAAALRGTGGRSAGSGGSGWEPLGRS